MDLVLMSSTKEILVAGLLGKVLPPPVLRPCNSLRFLRPDLHGSLQTAGLDPHLGFHLGQIGPAKRAGLR